MKPFIRWAGKKSRYIKYISPLLPKKIDTYYEPFVGSGALFLYMQHNKWVINDINSDLITSWINIRDHSKDIIGYINRFKKQYLMKSLPEKQAYCKKIIDSFNNNSSSNATRSAKYIVMKYCAYLGILMRNGIYKYSGIDRKYIDSDLPYFLSQKYFDNILSISRYLQQSTGQILNTDYTDILKLAKANDFVFLDPPYIEEHDYAFNYNKGEVLDAKFITDLYKQCKKLDRRRVKWLMTQADTPQIRQIFQEYDIKEMNVYRRARKAYATELIIRNYT